MNHNLNTAPLILKRLSGIHEGVSLRLFTAVKRAGDHRSEGRYGDQAEAAH
jgi:hypothetical protein